MTFLVYFFAVLKNVIYGLSVFFTGELSASVDVLDILALRFLMSFVVMWLLKTLKIIKVDIGICDFFRKNERTSAIKYILLASLFEPVLYMLFETWGVSLTTGITAGVILSLNPVTGCIAEEIFLKEKSTFLQKILLGIGIVGVIYIAANTSSADGKDTLAGILLVLMAVITGSLFLTFSRKCSKDFNAMERTYVASMLGMIVFNLVNVIRHLYAGDITSYFNPYFDSGNLMGFIFLGVVCAVIATGMNNFALGKMQVSTMSAFSGLSTLVTIAVGVIFGGEKLYTFHIIGLSLIVIRMVGVSYIQIKRDKKAGDVKKVQTAKRQ